MSLNVKFDNEELVRKAIDDVHNDTSDITWCCVTHLNDDPNVLTLQSTGKGDVEEMLGALSDTKVQYCLYRSTLKVDLSDTVKFTFIYNLGEKVSFFKKGRFGIVKGDAIKYFEPYHIDFEISGPNELSPDIIDKKLRDAAGVAIVEKNDQQENIEAVPMVKPTNTVNTTSTKTDENKTTPAQTTTTSAPITPISTEKEEIKTTNTVSAPASALPVDSLTPAPSNQTNTNEVNNTRSHRNSSITANLTKKFEESISISNNEKTNHTATTTATTTIKKPIRTGISKNDEVQFDQSIIDGIKKVRNDNDPTKWVIGSYQDDDINKPVVLIGSGEGDVNEMKTHFTPEKICYALVRVIDVYENINTVKFVFIYWLGSKVSVMKKAKISVHKGRVNEVFSNFHVDFMISSLNEISNDIVMRKVSQYSGSRSMVTSRK